jgi:nitrite reductase/ring-hydroxylating ferredoxin subunit/uncharacterized membrane protein
LHRQLLSSERAEYLPTQLIPGRFAGETGTGDYRVRLGGKTAPNTEEIQKEIVMPGILNKILSDLEESKILDKVAIPGTKAASKLVPKGPVKDALTGKWLGHPVHPLLTDVAIGFWTAGAVLDLLGHKHEKSAEVLTGLGILSAVPTALAGVADWVDTIGAERRVGLVHALGNTAALAAFTSSYFARRNGDTSKGKVLCAVGSGFLGFSGYLGGHLAYRMGSGVDRTAFDHKPQEWTPVLTDEELLEDSPVVVQAGDADVLLYRNSGTVCAIHNVCSHRGGPLNEGRIDSESRTVTCPWHASEFDLCTGEVVHGPASAPQPRFEARVNGGKVELREVKG